MSAICTCRYPNPVLREGNTQKHCTKCGYWYDEAHGSRPATEEGRHPDRSSQLNNLMKRKLRR